jgi:hypothetical protein
MSKPIPVLEPPSAADRARKRMDMLDELASLGMDLARALSAQALSALDPDAPDTPKVTTSDPVLMFTRVARAVRQTVALELRLQRSDEEAAAEDGRADALHERLVRKALVHEIASASVAAKEIPEILRERMLMALDARMEAEGPDEPDFGYMPIGVLVHRICEELGVRPDWSLWADAEWERPAARRRMAEDAPAWAPPFAPSGPVDPQAATLGASP